MRCNTQGTNLITNNESIEDIVKKTNYTVLYFYPKDNTPGCTIQAIEFSSMLDKFQKYNCQIIGVSKDSDESHSKFIKKNNLSIKLISDPDLKLHKEFNVLGEKQLYGKKYIGTVRSIFLLDKNRKIIKERRDVKASGSSNLVLDFIQKHD